jgi:hypothetical protein
MSRLIIIILLFSIIVFTQSALAKHNSFDDTGWQIMYQENFDIDFEAVDGQTFGQDSWLVFQLINGGAITVANGYAQLTAPDFWNAALIRSTGNLPDEYKIRTKIGYINYDLTNYEQADYDDPNFNDHAGHYENGMYFLTITDAICSGNECAEEWWHYHRKMVIDVDNHINWEGGGETFHPVYMVYMAPETNSGGNLLRTWNGTLWDESSWNWNVAYTYEYNTWYYAELEKLNNQLILRLYDESRNIIEETTPVSLDKIFAMDAPNEILYLGEPHTDDYEGDVRIDEITLLTVDPGVDADDDNSNPNIPEDFFVSQNYPNPFNPITRIKFGLPRTSDINLTIYNIAGQKTATLVEGLYGPGIHTIDWDASAYASGVYIYSFKVEKFTTTRKLILLK